MIDKRQYYVHGTAVRKLDYDVYEENELLKRKEQEKRNNKQKRKILMHVFLCCALALIMMYRYSVLTEMNYNMSKVLKEYEQIKNSNIALRVSIEKEENLFKVKEQAKTKLNMSTIDKSQIVYVKVPTSDFVKYTDAQDEKSGIVKVMTQKIENIKRYL
ncbi:MAG: cell division protein FtsL [Clostridiales bacterium]|nr:cell division protein FtsL [Clostridiales bacterium]